MRDFDKTLGIIQAEKRVNQNESFEDDKLMSKIMGKVALEQLELSEKWDKFNRRKIVESITESEKQTAISELANVMKYRRAKQGEDTPFIGRLGDIEFTLSPNNPSRISFAGEDNISSATIDKDNAFVEYGLESNSFLQYETDDVSATNLNLRRIIFVTSTGEISEEYFLSKKNSSFKLFIDGPPTYSGETDEETAKIVSDFISKHPEYEAGVDENTFVRNNISPTEVIDNKPLANFSINPEGLGPRWNDSNFQEYFFKKREGQDLNTIKTYSDIIPYAKKFGERCRKVYDIATAAYEKIPQQ